MEITIGVNDTNLFYHTPSVDRTIGWPTYNGDNLIWDRACGFIYNDGSGFGDFSRTDGCGADNGGGESIAPIPLNV